MNSVVASGFDRFPGVARNPSGELMVRLWRKARNPAFESWRAGFSTCYLSNQALPVFYREMKADVAVLFGVAGKRGAIRVEHHAVNRAHRTHPDARGFVYDKTMLDFRAPPRRSTDVRTQVIVAALRRQGLPARTSQSAGTYLCNFAYWWALQAVQRGHLKAAIFIHIPMPVGRDVPKRRMRGKRLTERQIDRAGETIMRLMAGRTALPFRDV